MIGWLTHLFNAASPGVGKHPHLTRSQIIWSCAYWGVWIFGMFLFAEILGLERVAPWVTLSETTWWVEKAVPIVATVLCGFLLGLVIHLRYGVKFGHAEAGGIIVSLVAHLLWGLV